MDSGAPFGIVTFLLTDVVASTRLWRESPLAGAALARQTELIQKAVRSRGGMLPPDQGEGDSTLAVFARPADALAAALDAQRAIVSEPWPDGGRVSVRMAVHTGGAELREGGRYAGLALIRAARIRTLAHGGQILVSAASAALSEDGLPERASLAALGSAALTGFARPEQLHELRHPDLPGHGRLGLLRAAPTSSLGPWPTSLVGRERERAEVSELVTANALVTITGAGGSGKTRLAHAIAEDHVERHADGVVWVELARLADAAQVAPAVVAGCGLMEVPGATALEVLTRGLARAEVLIVLDNCEHLPGACAEVAETLLRAGPGVHVLATSREPLGAAGETMWRIPSLAIAPEGELSPERVAEFDAVKLFVERARASRSDFRLDSESAGLVARVCRRLDGMPLALELAAARMRSLSLERLASGLDDRFRLLTGGARTAVARQRTLLASVEWSHSLLEPAEQAVFGRLAVFASPFSLEAAELVAADDDVDRLEVFDLLARLVDKSLVQHSGERYWLLETLRQYGLEHGDADELARARDRHLDWFRRRALRWGVDREILSEEAVAEIAAEKPDLIAALDWSLGADRAPAVELLQPLGACWPNNGAYAEARAVSGRVLASFEPGSRAWLEALVPLASALVHSGGLLAFPEVPAALAAHGESLSKVARSQLQSAVGWALYFRSQPGAFARLEQALETARESGSRTAEVYAAAFLAIGLIPRDLARARALAGWLERQVPERAPTIRPQINFVLGVIAHFDCDLATARTRFAGQRPGHAIYQALAALDSGDRQWMNETREWVERVEIGAFQGAREIVAGLAAILEGDLASAHEKLCAAGLGGVGALAAGQLCGVTFELGERAQVEGLVSELEQQGVTFAAPMARFQAELWRGYLARGEDQARAEAAAHAALGVATEFGAPSMQLQALELVALLAGDAGRLPEAGRLLAAADAFRERTGVQRTFQRAPYESLREQVGAAALEEGARLSLEEAVAYAQRGHGERRRPARGWDSLTPTEARVVELVASGLPNKEIAAKLFVSVATVKTHLLHVYGKLDVRTRADLAAQAARRSPT